MGLFVKIEFIVYWTVRKVKPAKDVQKKKKKKDTFLLKSAFARVVPRGI